MLWLGFRPRSLPHARRTLCQLHTRCVTKQIVLEKTCKAYCKLIRQPKAYSIPYKHSCKLFTRFVCKNPLKFTKLSLVELGFEKMNLGLEQS